MYYLHMLHHVFLFQLSIVFVFVVVAATRNTTGSEPNFS